MERVLIIFFCIKGDEGNKYFWLFFVGFFLLLVLFDRVFKIVCIFKRNVFMKEW